MEMLQTKINYALDEEIVDKIIGGETMLFEVLIRRYNSLLYKIARSYGCNHQDAEDLMQETHFAAFRYLKSFRKQASYKTWLTKIHLNHCYHKRNDKHEVEIERENEISNQDDVLNEISAGKCDAEKKVINKELGKVLETSLEQIPLTYRTVFLLREVEGFNVAETAELLKITPVNVKVRLNRAKAMLQKQLEKFYSAADLYEFHLMYCDKIVRNVFEQIAAHHGSQNHD